MKKSILIFEPNLNNLIGYCEKPQRTYAYTARIKKSFNNNICVTALRILHVKKLWSHKQERVSRNLHYLTFSDSREK